MIRRSTRGVALVRRAYRIAGMPVAGGGVTWPARNGCANWQNRERAAELRAAWARRA